jgi:hypothetical protein
MNIRADIDPTASTAIASRSDVILAQGMWDIDGPLCDAANMADIAFGLLEDAFARPETDGELLTFKLHDSEWERVAFAAAHAARLIRDAKKVFDDAFAKLRQLEGSPQ